MASIEEIRGARLQKLELLKKAGVDPYPIESARGFTLEEIVDDFPKLKKNKKIILAGRVMALRPQGGLTFFNLNDGTAHFQGLIKKEEAEKAFDLFNQTVDIGDFIEVEGVLFVTKREERTIQVKSWRMLAKSLRPLPEKWHGLQDTEERFRRRYLDALMSVEVKDRFIIRSKIISEIRSILDKAGYLEVETPALQPLYGGASAEPFTTHHNTLDMDLYLRISDELYLKRMLVAGFPKVYEIARDFRNEGIDATHNPEFTMLEFYEAYSDAGKQREFTESMIQGLVKKIFKKSRLNYASHEIDFSKKFAVVPYFEMIKRYAMIPNPEKLDLNDLKLHAARLGIALDKSDTAEKILDNIYKKTCRPKLVQPTFIIDYPAGMLPLAKRLADRPELVDAFQLVVGGVELVKAFSELNDPIDQKERFMGQEKTGKLGDKEAQPFDEDFIEAMEYGMPPAGGVGIGLDRLVMLLTDTHNIKEVIFFPTMRSKS
jgi:lysyl-tRNA synthetase class 2